ncbi:tyrosine-type recombinase/integrase [Emcibacteraceae bacterium]|nr:tyrosine-type recombinase/integrase [Emcibacteraceae bacterium]
MSNLTDLKARSIKQGDGALADGTVPGLRLIPGKIKGQGKWELRFKSPVSSKRRDMGLGVYPDVSLIDARELASEARRLMREGKDPIDERKAAKSAIKRETFKGAAEAAYESRKAGFSNAKHSAQWIQTIRTYALPKLGDKKVEELRASDFADMLRPIWMEKPETASRVKQRCDKVMEWCIARDLIAANPVKSVGSLLPKQPGKRERVTRHPSMPWQDVPKFVTDTLQAGGNSRSKVMLEFLILTATRSGEVREMEWSEIDIDEALWTIPAKRMRARVEHRVPLSDRAIAILQNQKIKAEHQTLVFPSVRGKVLTDMVLTKLLRDKQVKSDVKDRVATAHGFRSSFRNWASENGYSQVIAERALAHTIKNSVEWSYHRTDLLDQRRIAMDNWSVFVCGEASNTSKVLKLATLSKKN